MKNIFAFILLMVTFSACTEDIDLELNEGDNQKLVVDAWITDEPGPHEVRLSLSTSYFFNQEAPKVTDATVEISDGTSSITLSPGEPGIYLTPVDFEGKVGTTYELTINYNGNEYTAQATLNRVPEIEALESEYDDLEEEYMILLYTQEPPGEGDHYLFKNYKKGTTMADTLANVGFASDQFADGSYIGGVEVGYGDYEVGDTILFEMHSISEEAFDYFIAVMLETEWRGGIFDTPPANIPSNLSNGALGFFNASAVRKSELIIE